MKRLYWVAGLAVAGLVGALFIGPRFVDWNAWKPDIESRAAAWLGAPVAIGGNLSVDLLPSPRLTATQVVVGPADASAARVRWVRASLDLRELIKGSLTLKSMRLIEPEAHINRLVAVFHGAEEEATAQTAPPARDPAGFLGGQGARAAIPVEIEDGTFRGAPIEKLEVRLDDVDGSLTLRPGNDGGTEEVAFDGAFTLAQRRIAGGFRLQPRGRALRLGVELSAADVRADNAAGVSSLSFIGRSTEEEPQRFAGDLRVTAGRLTALPWLPGAVMADVARIAPGAVTLEGRLIADRAAETIELAKAAASTDDLRGTGGLTLSLGGRPRLALDLSLASLDLTRVDLPAGAAAGDLLEAETPPTATPPPEESAVIGDPNGEITADATTPPALDDPARFAEAVGTRLAAAHAGLLARVRTLAVGARAFEDLATTIDLSADTLRVPGGVVRKAALRASVSPGELLIERAGALLPGGSDLSIFGFVDTDAEIPRFEGELALQSDDARRMLEWLGWEDADWVRGIPRDRLRSVRLSASAVLGREGLRVGDLLADIDAATLSGSAVLQAEQEGAGDDGPMLSVELDADSLNLDAFRGDPVIDPTGVDPDAAEDAPAEDAGSGSDGAPAAMAARPAPFVPGAKVTVFREASAWARAIGAAPLAFDIDVGHLTFEGRDYQGARATLGTSGGERRATLSVDAVAALAVRAGIRFPLETARVDWRLALRVDGADLGGTAAAFGADPDWTQRARALAAGTLRATVDGNAAGLGFRADLGAGGDAIDGEAAHRLSLGGVVSADPEGGYRLRLSQGQVASETVTLDGVQAVARAPAPLTPHSTIAIEDARADLLGGTLALSGRLAMAPNGGIDLALKGGVDQLDLSNAVGDLGPLVRLGGTARLSGDLNARGFALGDGWPALDFAGHIDGRARLALREDARSQGGGFAQIDRLGKRLGRHFGGAGGTLDGRVTLRGGALRVADLSVAGTGARARGRLTLDLSEETVEGRLGVRETDAEADYLEVEVRGGMASPDVRTAGSWISGR